MGRMGKMSTPTLREPEAEGRTRVVILGGGPSGLTAAFNLTRTPALRQRFAVTVYQMGWRLGGKAASGRNLQAAARIEEHGLHVLFGFYQNFFAMMREVYDELDRPADHPMATLAEAFRPHDHGVIAHRHEDRWAFHSIMAPRNRAVPGVGDALSNGSILLGDFARGMLGLIFGWPVVRYFDEHRHRSSHPGGPPHRPQSGHEDALARGVVRGLGALFRAAHVAQGLIGPRVPALVRGLRRLRARFTAALARRVQTPSQRLVADGVDFLFASLIGVVVDDVFSHGGCRRLDNIDFADWLRSHGLRQENLRSPYVDFIYHAAFSFIDGRPEGRRIAAGTTLRILARVLHTYKGAMYYKMQAGMGDVVFAPLHELLERRGVRFKFFHELRALHLSPDGERIAEISIQRQAHLRADAQDRYAPLVKVKGLDCWPAEPRWEQLADAASLAGVNLESYYSQWPGVENIRLRAGRDFDRVVLATPVATLPFVASELLAKSPRWRAMVEHVQAVPTVSFQLWLRDDLHSLGWKRPPPLLSLYEEPLSTWCDMSQVLPREDWGAGSAPRCVAYFTGAHPGMGAPPPRDDRDYPDRCHAAAKKEAVKFLQQHVTTLWPAAGSAARPLDWNRLVAPAESVGEARFDSQYWRSNSEPTERCTLALPGTNRFRLRADATGFANLTIAGDWIDNGIYAACMEGATIGGILAARAVSGEPIRIVGEELFDLL